MEPLISLLTALNGMTPLGIIAMLVVVLYYQAKNHKAAGQQLGKLHKLETNDLHELPEMAEHLRKATETLQRIEVSMSTNFAVINNKLDGKN